MAGMTPTPRPGADREDGPMKNDAPERIWAAATKWAVGHGPELDWRFGHWKETPVTVPDPKQEYLRTDHALALVAEAYEVATVIASDNVAATVKAAAIRAMTPSDALAAREARDKRVRDEALREAAAYLKAHAPHLVDGPEHDVGSHYGYHIAADRILALIEGNQTDG